MDLVLFCKLLNLLKVIFCSLLIFLVDIKLNRQRVSLDAIKRYGVRLGICTKGELKRYQTFSVSTRKWQQRPEMKRFKILKSSVSSAVKVTSCKFTSFLNSKGCIWISSKVVKLRINQVVAGSMCGSKTWQHQLQELGLTLLTTSHLKSGFPILLQSPQLLSVAYGEMRNQHIPLQQKRMN